MISDDAAFPPYKVGIEATAVSDIFDNKICIVFCFSD